MVEGKTGEGDAGFEWMFDKNGLRRRGLRQRGRRSCEEGFRMFLFMFGVHPGVLCNDGGAGRGVSLVQNHKMEEARVRVSEWECLQHYTVINLWWLCIWTKVITIWDEGLHLYPGSEWKAAKVGGRWACSEETEANEDGWSHRSEKRGFKMFKAFDFTATMHQESRFMCGFHMSHEELYSMCHGSPNLDTISLKNMFSLSLKRHPGLCVFSCIGLIYLATFFFPSPPPAAHLFSSSACPSLSDTWPGVSMRGIL